MSQSASQRRLPAEWEPQSGVMLTWPHDAGDWAALLPDVEPVFFSIALHIALRESLLINCATASQRDQLRASLIQSDAPQDNLFMAVVLSNDTWARDHGPLTVFEHGEPRLLDFRFNGWGNKYPAQADNAITTQLAGSGRFGTTVLDHIDLVVEGGSIESDGDGTLLTTSRCLLDPQRNPGCKPGDADSSGQTDGIQFWGNSFIAGCQGEVLATAAQDEAELMIANIDKQRSEEVRRTWPYMRDRRIDAYDDLSLRFRDQ